MGLRLAGIAETAVGINAPTGKESRVEVVNLQRFFRGPTGAGQGTRVHGTPEEDAGHIAFLSESQRILDAVGHHGERDVRHDPDQFQYRRTGVEINRLSGAEPAGGTARDGLLLGRVLQSAFASRKLATVRFEADCSPVRAAQNTFGFQLFEVAPDGLLRHAGPLGNFRSAETASFVEFIQQPAVAINGKHEQRLGKCVISPELSQL